MEQPIFELVIVNEIMDIVRKANVGFYQRELSYSHCEISNILEGLLYQEKSKEEKRRDCSISLPFCNGDYLVPLLNKLRNQNSAYFILAKQILVRKFYTEYEPKTACPKGSFVEQIFSWMEQYIQLYKEAENQCLDERQLQVIFDFRLSSLLDNYDYNVKQKNKS